MSFQQTGVQQSPGKPGSTTCIGVLGRKCHHSEHPSPFPFPQLYMLSMRPYGVGYPSEQLGPAVPSTHCVPSQLLSTPSLHWCGEDQKWPWLCLSAAQQQLKHPHPLQCKSKTHTGCWEENYSIPARTCTHVE